MNTPLLTRQGNGLKRAFLLALLMALALFLPFIVIGKGVFLYYGDFNVQQVPFYQMAHDSVRSGNIFWSWTTDLGANFIGSYTFYLLGSPFFWLTLPFPSAAVPYLMGPLLILKFACASATAYALLSRFVRPNYAVLGGILYAFSGFSIYNVFFNHFHEAIIYFPLMLLALEWYMKDNRRGWFAVTVFLSAFSNYYFFIGQVFFILIYWFVRMSSGAWKCTLPKFLWLAFEAVIGTAAAGVLLLPAFYAVIQNPRTDSIIAGWDALYYSKPQRLFDILHSFFFPQDIPARENFFPDSDNKWASMSAWLPVFGCTGAIAYFQSRKHKDWLHRMLIICFFCAVIPGLNAMFQLFNACYYARWYYMMVLMLVLATVLCFEEAETVPVNWKRAFGWSFGITGFFALFLGFMPKSWKPDETTGKLTLGLAKLPIRFWIFVGIAVISLILASLLVMLYRHDQHLFARWSIGVVACVSLVYGWYLIGLGKANHNYSQDYILENALGGSEQISLPDDGETVRIDVYEGMDNLAMFWQRPTIQAFHSIVPGSVMEFYPSVGVQRGVGSRPDTSHYALRSLLSVRWLFDYEEDPQTLSETDRQKKAFMKSSGTAMPGWSYFDKQNGFLIYENNCYIPMGFTYDSYMTRTAYDELSESRRELVLLKTLVIPDEQENFVSRLLPQFREDIGVSYSKDSYMADCAARKATAAQSFTRDNRGFTATISLEQENLVFFSVPYEKGWSATVNGQATEIVQANVGFMAVVCPAGEKNVIRFSYMTPGLIQGLWITIGSILLFVLYMVLMRIFDRRMRRKLQEAIPEPLPKDDSTLLSAGESEAPEGASALPEDDAAPPAPSEEEENSSSPCPSPPEQ